MGFSKKWEPVINISWLKNEQVKVCFFTFESPYPYFCCYLRHNVMPYMYSEMQNKLSKTRESPLESMGQIISSRCPNPRAWLTFLGFDAQNLRTLNCIYTRTIFMHTNNLV